MMMNILSILCAMAGFFTSGGQTISSKDWRQVTKVVFLHNDASVAPDYYRSYTVTVTKEKIEVSVSNYDETLLTKQYPQTAEDFYAFIGKLKAAGVKKVREKVSVATGCTFERLVLCKGDQEFFSAYKECRDGNLKLERGSLSALFYELVPELRELVNQTRGR